MGCRNSFKRAEQSIAHMVVPAQCEGHQHLHVQALLMAQIRLGLERGYAMHTTVGCDHGEDAATAGDELTAKLFPPLLADARG